MGANSWGGNYNFDGYMFDDRNKEGQVRRFLQIFRNGVIESVDAGTLQNIPEDNRGRQRIPVTALENRLIFYVSLYLKLMQSLDVGFPVAVMLTLTGVLGAGLTIGDYGFDEGSNRIDRDTLELPEVLIEGPVVDVSKALKPLFDVIWNAAGWSGSRNYDESGERKPD